MTNKTGMKKSKVTQNVEKTKRSRDEEVEEEAVVAPVKKNSIKKSPQTKPITKKKPIAQPEEEIEPEEEQEEIVPVKKAPIKKKAKPVPVQEEEEEQNEEAEEEEEEVVATPKKKQMKKVSGTPTKSPKKAKTSGLVQFGSVEHDASEIEAYRTKNNMTVRGDDFMPIFKFDEITLPAEMAKYLKKFTAPTPIQSQTLPIVLSGRDAIGVAETGSGKTLAYTIPALVHIKAQIPIAKKKNLPFALVLAPTRELALQIEEVFSEMGKPMGIKTICVFGGQIPVYTQGKQLQQGVHAIIATPGRLADLIEQGYCDLSQVSYMVLDEADRMLDMGFEHQVKHLVSLTNAKRQNLFFTATWPPYVQKVAESMMNQEPIQVTIGSEDLNANHRITQFVEFQENAQSKDKRLLELLKKHHNGKNKIIVFVLYKWEATQVESNLNKIGFKSVGIHGNKSQTNRIQALTSFKTGEIPILIATDVAARGLDIPDVEYVINYSYPLTTESYVHRIGRTGRAGKTGIAYTFFNLESKDLASGLIGVLREANQEVPEFLIQMGPPSRRKSTSIYGDYSRAKGGVNTEAKATHIKFD